MTRSKVIRLAPAALIVLACLAPPAAAAPLLISPAGGTTLFTSADDAVVTRNLGFSGNFFGSPTSTVDVSTNGNLNFSGDISLTNQALPFGPARISPLWDDWFLSGLPGEAITESVNAGVYYAVTYSNVETFNTGAQFTFQAIWFGAATVLGDFSFLANDIAFLYAAIGDTLNDAASTAGLDAGDGARFAALPGTSDGLVTAANKDSVLVTGPQFVLFRPTIFGATASAAAPWSSSTFTSASAVLPRPSRRSS